MNVKKAKKLRKELSYKPSDKREYLALTTKRYALDAEGKKTVIERKTVVNDPTSPRGKYLKAKKEAPK